MVTRFNTQNVSTKQKTDARLTNHWSVWRGTTDDNEAAKSPEESIDIRRWIVTHALTDTSALFAATEPSVWSRKMFNRKESCSESREREREIGRKRVSHEMLHAPERQLLTDVSGADKMLISFLPTPQNEYANFFYGEKNAAGCCVYFHREKKNVVFPRFDRNVSDKLSTARPQTATCRPLNPFVTVLCCH